MPIVTDKRYYLEQALIDKIEYVKKRNKKNFDGLFIIDGDEGYGKSTFAFAIACYYAYITGKNFTVKDNIFFDVDQLIKVGSETEDNILLWDEAAVMGMGTDWQNKIQKKLVKFLMMARKKRHFMLFLIPSFHKLNEYIAVYRARALLHVYSEDDLTRGQFVYFNRHAKDRLYWQIKQQKYRSYKDYTFHGKFTDTSFLVDQDDYDQLKDKAIKDILEDEKKTDKFYLLSKYYEYIFYTLDRYTGVEKGKILGRSKQTISDWQHHPKIYPEVDTMIQDRGGRPRFSTPYGVPFNS